MGERRISDRQARSWAIAVGLAFAGALTIAGVFLRFGLHRNRVEFEIGVWILIVTIVALPATSRIMTRGRRRPQLLALGIVGVWACFLDQVLNGWNALGVILLSLAVALLVVGVVASVRHIGEPADGD